MIDSHSRILHFGGQRGQFLLKGLNSPFNLCQLFLTLLFLPPCRLAFRMRSDFGSFFLLWRRVFFSVYLLNPQRRVTDIPFAAFTVQELSIIAEIRSSPMVCDLNNPFGQGVNKVAIVGNKYQGTLVAFQCLQENFLGSQVKVVGRLVQQHKIGRLKQQDSQGQTVALPSREDGDPLMHVITMKKKGTEKVANLWDHIERRRPGNLLENRQF